MAAPSSADTQNILPVQALFNTDNSFNTFIGQGQPFTATISPDQSGLHITNSTIDSTTIGAITPSTAAFSSATVAATPTGSTDIANKLYVDSYVAGISWKPPVNYGTTANITLSGLGTQAGGDWASTLTAGMRVLVKNQSTAAENGIYVAASGAWTRSDDANAWNELVSALVFIESGNTLGGSAWYCSAQPGGTLGSTAVNWSNFSVAATYTAGTGLTLAGYQFSITNTGVAAATYGSASSVPVFAVNQQGQLTSVTNTSIAITNSQVSGLGTMSVQNANSVAITGGTISGLGTPLAVGSGGTGAATLTGYVKGSGTSAFTATASIPSSDITGLGTMSTQNANAVAITGGTISGLSSPLAVASGGSGAATLTGYLKGNGTSAYTASATIPSGDISGLGTTAVQNANAVAITGGTISGTTLTTDTVSNYLAFTATTAPTYAAGSLWYDSATAALSYYNDTTNNIVRVGAQLQQQVRNSTAATITKGSVVYISGSTGQIGNVILAQANAYTTSQVIGVAAQDIPVNGNGYIVIYGTVENVNTAGLTAGQNIYLSATTAGALTQTEPSAPNYAVHMGVCLYSNAVNGKLLIVPINKSIDSGYFIGQLAISAGGTNGTATPTAGAVAYGTGSAYAFTAAGTSGQVLTSSGTGAPTWTTPTSYATVTDDTTTNATRYILFANVTTGNLTTEYVSSTKLKYNPSSGALTASQLIIAP